MTRARAGAVRLASAVPVVNANCRTAGRTFARVGRALTQAALGDGLLQQGCQQAKRCVLAQTACRQHLCRASVEFVPVAGRQVVPASSADVASPAPCTRWQLRTFCNLAHNKQLLRGSPCTGAAAHVCGDASAGARRWRRSPGLGWRLSGPAGEETRPAAVLPAASAAADAPAQHPSAQAGHGLRAALTRLLTRPTVLHPCEQPADK